MKNQSNLVTNPASTPPNPPKRQVPTLCLPRRSQAEAGRRLGRCKVASRSPIKNRKSKIENSPYSIRKHISFWSLTFNGQEACFDHEQGAYYVGYLLLNPPDEPIHGMALEMKAEAFFGCKPEVPCETFITDPQTGQILTLACDADVAERHLSVDDAEGCDYIWRKTEELEAILEKDIASEPVKAEVRRELEDLYAYQQKTQSRVRDTSRKTVRAVREAIHHFHQTLAKALDPKRKPHPILRPFAEHLQHFLIIPSARFCKVGHVRSKANGAGCFTYEPPAGVNWTP